MTAVTVRQSGGADIVSIPKAIGKTLGIKAGSQLELSIEDNKIVLTPIKESQDLASLLADSPKDCFAISEEDREWLDADSILQNDKDA